MDSQQTGKTMDRNTFFGRVAVVKFACACVALLSLNCSSPPASVGAGDQFGGVSGGGQSGAVGEGGAGGSVSTDDAGLSGFKFDVQPGWWGTADAPQGPEVLSPPTVDSNCGLLTSKTKRQPVDVMLVLDRSASMQWSIAEDCYCTNVSGAMGGLCDNTTDCTTRWDAVKPAVTTTLANSSYVNWGLKFFPSASGGGGPGGPMGGASCNENTTMEVQITATSGTDVESRINNNTTFDLGTPTAAALTAATAYLRGLDDGNDKFILLATDGEPNCGGDPPVLNTDDVSGASSAAADAYAAGFQVFVIGIGPNLDNLTQLADAGGTTDFYPVNSPDDLAAALSSISKLVGSCSFTSDETPPDDNNIAVYVNGKRVAQDPNNGWTFGANSQEIILTGDYCAQMSSGDQADVQILFGCPGQPDFPPDIY
jgi:hypothetical protein